MSAIFDKALEVARDAVPTVLCTAGGLSRLGQDIAGKVNPFYDGSLLEGYQSAVSNALNGFCDLPPGGEPVAPTQPFNGGQCAGVSYRVTGSSEATRDDGSSGPLDYGTFLVSDVRGPITYIGQSPTNKASGILIGKNFQGQSQTFNIGASSDLRYTFRLKDYSIVRNDGGPDNCGDPPPVFPPGTPNPTDPEPPPTTVVINLPDVGDVSVTFSPIVGIVYVDANAEFNVPVTVNVDVGGIDVNFDLEFDVNISNPTTPTKPRPPSPPRNPDGRPEPPDCPPPARCINEPPEDPPAVEPPPVDEKVYVVSGAYALCLVNILECAATEILQENGPNIWAPKLGYIRFQYLTNSGEVVWGTDIAVKGTNFVTGAPDIGLKCIGAVLNTERGVTGELVLLKKLRTAGCC